jgi:hypothetical protein
MFRSSPQDMLANHLCCLTSLAPELDPNRLCSSLINSFLMADLHKLETGIFSGKCTSTLSTLANVALRLGPLKGVVANYITRYVNPRCPTCDTDETTHNHLVHQDTQSPPVDSARVTIALNDLWGDVLLGADERVGSEIGNTRPRVHHDSLHMVRTRSRMDPDSDSRRSLRWS